MRSKESFEYVPISGSEDGSEEGGHCPVDKKGRRKKAVESGSESDKGGGVGKAGGAKRKSGPDPGPPTLVDAKKAKKAAKKEKKKAKKAEKLAATQKQKEKEEEKAATTAAKEAEKLAAKDEKARAKASQKEADDAKKAADKEKKAQQTLCAAHGKKLSKTCQTSRSHCGPLG